MGSHSVMPSTMPSSRAFQDFDNQCMWLSCVRDALFVALDMDLSILPKVALRAAKQQEAHTLASPGSYPITR